MVKEIGHFIGGKAVAGTSGRFADVFDPNTGEVQAKVALASEAELKAAVADAKAAQPAWAATNPQRRARIMSKFVELVNAEKEELAQMLSAEHGKTIPDSHGDIQRGIEVCFGGVRFVPGHFLFADNNGVIVSASKAASAGNPR